MKAIWAKGLSERLNTTVAFTLDLKKDSDFTLKTAVASCYKIYLKAMFE